MRTWKPSATMVLVLFIWLASMVVWKVGRVHFTIYGPFFFFFFFHILLMRRRWCMYVSISILRWLFLELHFSLIPCSPNSVGVERLSCSSLNVTSLETTGCILLLLFQLHNGSTPATTRWWSFVTPMDVCFYYYYYYHHYYYN